MKTIEEKNEIQTQLDALAEIGLFFYNSRSPYEGFGGLIIDTAYEIQKHFDQENNQ